MKSPKTTIDNYIFPTGIIHKLLSQNIPSEPVLSQQDQINLETAISTTKTIISKYNYYQSLYLRILKPSSKFLVKIKDKDGKEIFDNKEKTKILYNNCSELKESITKHIEYIAGKASLFLYARQYQIAEHIFKIALDFSIEILKNTHYITLAIESDYAFSLFYQGDKEKSKEILDKTVTALEQYGITDENKSSIKRSLALIYNLFSQNEMNNKNLDLSLFYLEKSKALRKEYNASEKEFDKINYTKATILYHQGKIEKSRDLLKKVYHFRKNKSETNPNLMPVLNLLIIIMNSLKNTYKELDFYFELLKIQKYNKINNRYIVSTQLKILKLVANKISLDEYFTNLSNITSFVENLSLTEESISVGLNYLDLAETRLSNLLPESLSFAEKREYYSDTLNIIAKAEIHIKLGKNDTDFLLDKAENIKRHTNLKEKCYLFISTFDDPTWMQLKPRNSKNPEEKKEASVIDPVVQEELKILSDFSSEVDHSLVTEGILTKMIFDNLPEIGIIDPCRLRTAQGGINREFRDGRTLKTMINELVKNPDYTKNVVPVEIGIHQGKVYSFDTRRVIVHQKAREQNADVYIRYRKISGDYLEERKKAVFSPRPYNGLVTAERRGGKNSESTPYINPLYRKQLEKKVEKSFQKYPSTRVGADPNGFSVDKKLAQKIMRFLRNKANNSKEARLLLVKAKKISIKQGKDAAYRFLITQKNALKP